MSAVEVSRGDGPVVLGLPHTGTFVPDDIRHRLNENGRGLADTDWHVHELYEGLLDGVTTVRTPVHRYVIDCNRDPSRASLYPGMNTTALVPDTDFDGKPIWKPGAEPTEADIAHRLNDHFWPYHVALEAELARVRERHGVVILYDCHSIRGDIPFLFAGRLTDLNIGTDSGKTCAELVEKIVIRHCKSSDYSCVLNGRFKGGWTTRHYGRPAEDWHAIQMEIAQAAYMDETPPWTWRPEKAERLRTLLRAILSDLADLAPTLKGAA
ncbi:N-formylglutamate deformylase [Sulfitobacter sp. D35]|uniref:N-formylglutamate deformylase n=1 Tax=Sulfitobacter sp. D35 TaxID=3083252 RepID=UPI00296F79DB|nr:N-formylglutamate deformylase [Sulfitobacter sp. D35]MDW4497258.1 N-formylglutamate deformylase [Sulfitobacter sp. D35]